MQRSISENNVILGPRTRSCKNITPLPERKKRCQSFEQSTTVKPPKKQKLRPKEDWKQANMCQQQLESSSQSIDVSDLSKRETISTNQNACLAKVIPPLDDHDLTPYLMEVSDDEQAGIQSNKDEAKVENVDSEATRRKFKTGKKKNRKLYDFSTMDRKCIELELEHLKEHNEELLCQLNKERQEKKDLENCIENMKAEKSSPAKNDITIYGGHCTMQVGDSSLLESGGQERIKDYVRKRMDAQDTRLNRIESKLSEMSSCIKGINDSFCGQNHRITTSIKQDE